MIRTPNHSHLIIPGGVLFRLSKFSVAFHDGDEEVRRLEIGHIFWLQIKISPTEEGRLTLIDVLFSLGIHYINFDPSIGPAATLT